MGLKQIVDGVSECSYADCLLFCGTLFHGWALLRLCPCRYAHYFTTQFAHTLFCKRRKISIESGCIYKSPLEPHIYRFVYYIKSPNFVYL